MAHSLEKLREIEKRIDLALERPELTNWSRTFLRDMRVRIAKYGKNVRFSQKQANALRRLIDYDVNDSSDSGPWAKRENVTSFAEPPKAKRPSTPWKKVRRLPRGGARTAAFAIIFGLIGAGAAFAALSFFEAKHRPLNALDVRVIDGDTINIAGATQNVRLVGFNTPETSKPECSTEERLGRAATDRLKNLIATNDIDFAYVRCACPLGKAGTPDCNYGRLCGSLRVGGEDVGAILVAEGLAVPFNCGWTSCPSLPRPWCRTAAAPTPATLMGTGQTSSGKCNIKGNISMNSGERIYHVPGQEYYDETRITEGKGERWFCSEAEARAAGWRRAKR